MDFQYEVTKDDLAKNKEFTPQLLPTEDYICKLTNISLEKVPKWNASKNIYDYSDTELKWVCILQPYKLKSGDDMLDIDGKEIKPLSMWVWRQVNPFSLGFTKDSEPSHQRAIISYSNGEQPEGDVLRISHIIVLDKENNLVPDDVAKKYVQEMADKKNGTISDEQMIMKKAGYKHIPDLRTISEGKYISCKIVLSTTGKEKRNKVTGFSKVPSSFKPNDQVEAESTEKFKESYKKMVERKNEKNNVHAENSQKVVKSVEVPTQKSFMEEEVSISDVPF